MGEPIDLAVLLSGSGRTLENFFALIEAGKLDARVSVVIGSRADAYGLERARKHGVPAVVVPQREYNDFEALSEAIVA